MPEVVQSTETTGKALLKLLRLPHNRICADCRAPLVESHNIWGSLGSKPLPHAVFVCISCCTAHRSIGSSSIRVKSVHMDQWNRDDVQVGTASLPMRFLWMVKVLGGLALRGSFVLVAAANT